MSGAGLSPRVVAKLEKLFSPVDRAFAADWLASECAAERVQAAVLKLSGGSLDKLAAATELAAIDWRDVLAAAGFDRDPQEHEAWLADEA